MTFSDSDFGQATVRVLSTQHQTQPVGAGFLIAPGYVLTCAHVVLQALGINENDFENSEYRAKPSERVYIDFPIQDVDQRIESAIIDWVPYDPLKGDIAVLKLLTPQSNSVRPIPVSHLDEKCEDVEKDKHSIYGFPTQEGTRSDAYCPKVASADERWQLCKRDDPNDETIVGGFSGGPLWKRGSGYLSGMIATARPKTDPDRNLQSKAYAISVKRLRPILNNIYAYVIADLLEPYLDNQKARKAIEKAFWLCDVPSNRTEPLLDRLLQLLALPNREWRQGDRDVDRITQFVIYCRVGIDAKFDQLADSLQQWIEHRQFDFKDLYFEANERIKNRDMSASERLEHIIVDVRFEESDRNLVNVGVWEVTGHDPFTTGKNLVTEREMPISIETMPLFIDKKFRTAGLTNGIVHLFLPDDYIDEALDMTLLNEDEDEAFGGEYTLVFRTKLKLLAFSKKRHEEKWKTLKGQMSNPAKHVFQDIDVKTKPKPAAKKANAGILQNAEGFSVGNFLCKLSERSALPLLLWSRRDVLGAQIRQDLLNDCTVQDVPRQVQNARQAAATDENQDLLGYHLGLIWDDPEIPLLTAEQIDPEQL